MGLPVSQCREEEEALINRRSQHTHTHLKPRQLILEPQSAYTACCELIDISGHLKEDDALPHSQRCLLQAPKDTTLRLSDKL